jgi:methylmalonyl-CoA mutase N-terminal domain/subunit
MRHTFGAADPRSWLMRFHTQTAGVSLAAQQPENNIVRVTVQALAAVLGGTQSLHTNSMDETLALPSEKAALIALRTQQIIACETGVANTIDPLAGSYFVEALTNRLEKEAYDYFERIESMGGVVKAIDRGFFQKEISDAAYAYQKKIEQEKAVVVGVNEYVVEDEKIEIPILKIDPEVERVQVERVKALRARRDNGLVKRRLEALRKTAASGDNLMPAIVEAARAYVTLGEMIDVLKSVFGEYKERPIF